MSAGDRLLAIDRQPLYRFDDLQTFLKRRPRSVVVTIRRHQAQQELQINFKRSLEKPAILTAFLAIFLTLTNDYQVKHSALD